MSHEDEIKQFMARAMKTMPKNELKQFVVDTVASQQNVNWKTLEVPQARKQPKQKGAPKQAPAPPSRAPAFLPPPPPTDRLPTAEELSQFQQFMQFAQSPMAPMAPMMGLKQAPLAAKPSIGSLVPSQKDLEMAEKRKMRFNESAPPKRSKPAQPPATSFNNTPLSTEPLLGTSETLEKQYLRLTSQPKPENVRPKRVLKKSLPFVLDKFKQEGKYSYVISQLKSIRQDLNVQGIKDGFTVRVYETNARIALENRDLGEFNQCISRLSELYQDPQLSYTLNSSSGEFLSYHIYYILYTQAHQDLDIILNKVRQSPELKASPEIQGTLKLVEAYLSQDTLAMFALYRGASPLAQIAMENIVRHERLRCLAALTKARKKSTISLPELQPLLGFESTEEVAEFVGSLTKHLHEGEVVCKDAFFDFERAWEQVSRSKVDIKGQI